MQESCNFMTRQTLICKIKNLHHNPKFVHYFDYEQKTIRIASAPKEQ
jgi:hypothetical protein